MKPRTTSSRKTAYTAAAPHQRGEAGRATRRNPAGGKPLSIDQKAALCQLARNAFDHLDNLGLVDAPGSSHSARLKAWRTAQQAEAVGIASLTECGNNHYRALRAHFNALMGKDDVAFSDHMRTGQVKDHGAAADTHEARETNRNLIMQELLAHQNRCDSLHKDYDAKAAAHVAGKYITTAYVISIAKAKCRGRGLDSLTAKELSQILYTVRNRIASREGRPVVSGRNKSQKQGGRNL